jgi:hypothetical protein
MKRALGKQETQFLAYAQMRELRAVRTGELVRPLGLTREQERELFRRLARRRLIARVRPGLYLVPKRLPLGGSWSPDEILALNTLIEDRGGRYQICGPNAFNRYGFDEQVPARVYAYNNRISGERSIGSVRLTLIKVADARLGGTEEVATSEGPVAGVRVARARAGGRGVRLVALQQPASWLCVDPPRAGKQTRHAGGACGRDAEVRRRWGGPPHGRIAPARGGGCAPVAQA